MTLLTCAAVRRRLPAFYDRELPVPELIAIEAHLGDCPPCLRDLREMQQVGDALRLAAAPGPADDWTGLQPGVISRMRAEEHESWTERAKRAFDDLHLVWIGMASTVASFMCAAIALSMLHFATPQRNTSSLAAMIAVIAAPNGSDLNPARPDGVFYKVPSLPEDPNMLAALANSVSHEEEDVVVPMSAVVSRDGSLSGLELLTTDYDLRDFGPLVHELSRSRLEPAQYGGAPVAVDLIWVVAHTTVRAKSAS
jgi:anti-sigma factor RsiW